jgi:hypothetical protein
LPAWTERGILIYGPRKAGTTLFHNLLDGSSELFVYPAELKAKSFVKTRWDIAAPSQYRAHVRADQLERAGIDVPTYNARWDEAAQGRSKETLATLIKTDATIVFGCSGLKDRPKMWCAKDVGGRTHAITSLWRSLFENAKFVFILRDPRMVTRSVLLDRRRKGRRLSVRKIIRETYDPMRVITAQAKYVHDPAVSMITYEDLVGNTADTMKHIAGVLGITYSKALESPSIFGKPVVVRTSSRKVKSVFASKALWYDDLTWRERIVVLTTRAVCRLLPAFNARYKDLRCAIKARQERPDKPPE